MGAYGGESITTSSPRNENDLEIIDCEENDYDDNDNEIQR